MHFADFNRLIQIPFVPLLKHDVVVDVEVSATISTGIRGCQTSPRFIAARSIYTYAKHLYL
jgi:hypothetical protein